MDLKQRIQAFTELAEKIKSFKPSEIEFLGDKAQSFNNWFSIENLMLALDGILNYLDKDKLEKWVSPYSIADDRPKKIGVIMAGNIPLVGFHDFLSVLISGNILKAKLSKQDPFLLPYLSNLLIEIEPSFIERVEFVEKISGLDAVIATGSDNTAKYFRYYFAEIPYVIRQNRTSVAILNGEESENELWQLGKDIFSYYGLGCRNVSKLYVPAEYDFKKLLQSLEPYNQVRQHHKYVNNYDYNKSIYLVNRKAHLDNGTTLLTESEDLVSPISVLYYEYYDDHNSLKNKIAEKEQKIQCIVSKDAWYDPSKPLGQAQKPELWNYADGVDTLNFLTNL